MRGQLKREVPSPVVIPSASPPAKQRPRKINSEEIQLSVEFRRCCFPSLLLSAITSTKLGTLHYSMAIPGGISLAR